MPRAVPRTYSDVRTLLPSLSDKVWVGVSAGSMVMTPRIGTSFVEWPSAPDDTLDVAGTDPLLRTRRRGCSDGAVTLS